MCLNMAIRNKSIKSIKCVFFYTIVIFICLFFDFFFPLTLPVSLPETLPVNHSNWLIWANLTDKMNPIPFVRYA